MTQEQPEIPGPEEIQCPGCQGRGTNRVLANLGGHCEQRDINCLKCRGKGTITETMLTWAARGEAMRQDRISRKVSLREEAERLSIPPVELSQMEHGATEPVDFQTLTAGLEATAKEETPQAE